ncbi:hypothetical protein ON010_g15854 [Phytophthora cinnamomi]|nr:hypothetical protein ON010_g15854 [Phytophthora cinnamomi]
METEPITSGAILIPKQRTVFVTERVKKSRARQRHQIARNKRVAMKGVMVVSVLLPAVVYVMAVFSLESAKVDTVAAKLMELDPAHQTRRIRKINNPPQALSCTQTHCWGVLPGSSSSNDPSIHTDAMTVAAP